MAIFQRNAQVRNVKEPVIEKFDTWYNPTDKDVTLDMYAGGEGHEWVRYVVPAKGEAQIPDRYRRAIAWEEGGVIQQGMAPFLQRRGSDAKIHSSLDPEAGAKREAYIEAEKRLMQERLVAEAMKQIKEQQESKRK